MPIDDVGDADRFELIFLDTPYRLAREVSILDAGRNIYTVADRDKRSDPIAKDADQVTVLFLEEHITGTFSASSGYIMARGFNDGTSLLIVFIGRNPGTLERWSELRAELDRLDLLRPLDRKTVISIQDKRVAAICKMAVEDGLTDLQIGDKFTIGAPRVKQIRLANGIKRRERKKSLS
jgi:hypothetical protein